jgi:hypothetical protein
MAPRPPFKRDLTPIGRGGITKHAGKGATEMSGPGRGALTGGSMLARMGNQYGKPPPAGPPPMTPLSTGPDDTDGLGAPPAAVPPSPSLPGNGGDGLA